MASQLDQVVLHEMEDDLVPNARTAIEHAILVVGELHDAATERSGLHDLTKYDEAMGCLEDARDAVEAARLQIGEVIE